MQTRHLYIIGIIMLNFFTLTQAVGQTPLKHEKKYFIAEDSTIFWQGHMPVYIFISSSPEGTNPIRLNSSNLPQYSNPLYLDTEGSNFIRTRWAVDPETKRAITPAQEVEFRVENDRLPPVTTITLTDAPKHVSNGQIYYGKGLKASLTAEDGLCGVADIYQSVDKSEFNGYTGTFNFNQEGEHVIQYYAVDKVGNAEEPSSKIFQVDATAPTTDLQKSGDEKAPDVFPKSAIFSLDATDALSGVKSIHYAFDEQNEKATSGKVALGSLSEGQHTIKYYATDHVENTETASTYSFYLDDTPPMVRIEFEGARHKANGKTFIAGPTKVRIDAVDNKAGVDKIFYSFDGKNYDEYTGPFLLKKTQKTSWIKFYAIDKVENKSTAQTDLQVGSIYLDLTAPGLSYTFEGEKFTSRDTTFITAGTNVHLKASDSESGILEIGYEIDGGAKEGVFEGELKIEDEGFHTISYYGKDNVQNMRREEFYFVVDNTGPEIFYHLSMDAIGQQMLKEKETPIPVYANHTKLYLAATDKLVGTDKIYYSMDGGPEKLYTEPILTSKAGLRTLTIRATDKLGNESTLGSVEFVIQ